MVTNPFRGPASELALSQAVDCAVEKMKARAADIPGLWYVNGYPELTTSQLLQVAART